jgi:uncharacterized glyoxalase superfamily protein PhnB
MEPWIPAAWPRVTPRLFVEQPAECVAFIKEVFGAGGEYVSERPTVLEIVDSRIMISASAPREATKSCLYVYLPSERRSFDD